MTRLDQLEHQLDYLLSQYQIRKHDPAYKVQIALIASQVNALRRMHSRDQSIDD